MRLEYNEVDGDLIKLALNGEFDVIAHGCNCFCTMGAGIAPQMVRAFGVDGFSKESSLDKGDINKLGTIDYEYFTKTDNGLGKYFHVGDIALVVINTYTQYNYGANHSDGVKTPVDYDAIRLVMRKINRIFKSKHIGLPKIGCGLAGGNWAIVKNIIQEELTDCKVTIVHYKP